MQHIADTLTALSLPMADPEAEALPILPYWPELVFGIISFGILYWVVATKVVPNLEKAYAERTAAIEGGMEEAEQAQAEAEAARQKYVDQLAEARDEAARIREDAKEQGAAIIADLRQQAKDEADRITETAHKQIDAERKQAMVSLRGEVGAISTDLASRIVGESLNDQTRSSGVVDRFLAELENGSVKSDQVATGQES